MVYNPICCDRHDIYICSCIRLSGLYLFVGLFPVGRIHFWPWMALFMCPSHSSSGPTSWPEGAHKSGHVCMSNLSEDTDNTHTEFYPHSLKCRHICSTTDYPITAQLKWGQEAISQSAQHISSHIHFTSITHTPSCTAFHTTYTSVISWAL